MLTKIWCLILVSFVSTSQPHTVGSRHIAAAIKHTSVLIRTKGVFNEKGKSAVHMIGCSGTYVSPTTILTAAHCFEDYTVTDIWARDPDQKKGVEARLLKISPELDLALLRVTHKHEFARIGASPQTGDIVLNVGSPVGLEFLVSEGIIAATNRIEKPFTATYLVTTAMINSGSSGGGAFDDRGNLVGVNTMTIGYFGWMGISLAVDTKTIKGFLK